MLTCLTSAFINPNNFQTGENPIFFFNLRGARTEGWEGDFASVTQCPI